MQGNKLGRERRETRRETRQIEYQMFVKRIKLHYLIPGNRSSIYYPCIILIQFRELCQTLNIHGLYYNGNAL